MLSFKPSFIFLSIILNLLFLFIHAQPNEKKSIQVKNTSGQTLKFPWAGGMNSCQYGLLDIDLDGIKDLVVFDRTGNRVMPFLYDGSAGTEGYDYVPEYAAFFPPLSDWVIFADYDGDGKEDIFTYNTFPPGIIVYRNVSMSQLEFRLQVFPFLTSFQGGGYVNILVTYADYPGIYDLDGDGDLDILSFYGLGSFVEMHRNMSMEKYSHRDSLDFMRTTYCWGFFAESEESNALTLDTCLGGKTWDNGSMGAWDYRHTGSTFQMLDLNGDQLIDLLLGDVDYPNLVALYNGGNDDTARITSYDWEYPDGNDHVWLFSMPVAYHGDIDGDALKDLLVSTFDPNPFIVNNFKSSWYYKNYGNNDHPQFFLQTRTFLQEDMIDVGAGAYPVFFDYDNDGLMDLFIANYGYYDTSYYDEYMMLHTEHTGQLALFRNAGTAQEPDFTWVDRDFAGISDLGLRSGIPAFGDMDGDGDADMLVGGEDGKLTLYLNIAAPGKPMELQFGQFSYQNIDVGSYSAPQLFDLDQDGLLDLVIGERAGNLNYYRNNGSLQQPLFTLVTDSLGKVNVTNNSVSLDGYSVPCFFRDTQDLVHLLVGSEQGDIFYFTGINEYNFNIAYERSDTLAALLGLQELDSDRGYRTSAALHDLTGDGVPELITGNFSGGVEYFGISLPPAVSSINEADWADDMILMFPNPARDYLNISVNIQFEAIRVEIRDLSGRCVGAGLERLESISQIDVSKLSDGIYILHITLREISSTNTIVIRKKMLKI